MKAHQGTGSCSTYVCMHVCMYVCITLIKTIWRMFVCMCLYVCMYVWSTFSKIGVLVVASSLNFISTRITHHDAEDPESKIAAVLYGQM